MKNAIIIVIVVLLGVLVISQRSEDISNEDALLSEDVQQTIDMGQVKKDGGYITLSANDILGAVSSYVFTAVILEDWEIKALNRGKTLNFYDPAIEAENLEQSQIFVTSFVANDFQISEQLNVLSRTEHRVDGQLAVTYVISQDDGQNIFNNQPEWRGETHKTTNIRLQDDNPSLFYVFAKNPGLSEAEFQRFLSSIEF